MNERQRSLLELLDDLIYDCKECPLYLHSNKALPYWTPVSQYLIIGEYPNKDTEASLSPYFWDILNKYDFKKEEFAIINRIQCTPDRPAPTTMQIKYCEKWVRKFIKCIDPIAGLLVGRHSNIIKSYDLPNARRYSIPYKFTDKRFDCVYANTRKNDFEMAVIKFREVINEFH